MKKYNILILAILVAITTMLISCKTDSKETHPDVSKIKIDFDIIRLDEIVARMDTNNISHELDIVMDRYPAAATLYFGTLNPFTASRNRDTIAVRLGAFLRDPFFQNLQDTIELIYSDMTDIKEDFTQAYKYFHYYFPEADIANVYTMNTGFNYQRFLFPDDEIKSDHENKNNDSNNSLNEGKNALGIGLELFLGDAYPYKRIDPQNPSFSTYLTRSFDKEHLVKKSIEILVDDQIGQANGVRMIDHMIHNGKRLYILDHLMPETHDSIIMEYTTKQMQWAKENELSMWGFFFDQELFYETNMMSINKYLSPSPNSPGMPAEAPGRTANYMGWQIVKKYMQRNPKATMQDLIAYTDAQKFLEESKYKPR